MLRTISVVAAMVSFAVSVGCGASHQSTTHGATTCAQPAGQPVPAQQSQSDLQLSMTLTGAGSFQAVESTLCTLTSGDLSESSTSSGTIQSDGTYVGAFDAESAGTTWTSPLCGALKNVKLTSVTSLTVNATVPTNDSNCQAYCTSSASAQCQGSADPNCQASAAASCTTSCKAGGQIKGHGTLQQSDVASTNNQLSGSGQFDAKVDLLFDAVQ